MHSRFKGWVLGPVDMSLLAPLAGITVGLSLAPFPQPHGAVGPESPWRSPMRQEQERSSSATQAVEAYIAKAKAALQTRDFSQAKAQLELALHADPRSPEAYELLGIVESQNGETGEAIGHFEHALRFRPDSFSGHYNLALAYLRERSLAKGLQELEKAVALNPHHADATYNLGVVLLEVGQPEEALVNLRRAQSLGPDRHDISINIVRAELAAGHGEVAAQEAERVAKEFGGDPAWQAAVGRLLLMHGLPHAAVEHLREAQRLEPSWDEVRRQLAQAYLESDNPAAALSLIPNPQSPEDHFTRAAALYGLRHLPEADEELGQALPQDPENARAWLLRARIRQRLGDHEAALEFLRRASQLSPQWSEPYYSLGVSYYFERRYADARRALDRALERDPRSARAMFLYAATLVNESKNRAGEEYLRRAITIEPANARFFYLLGALRLRDNRPSEAREALEEALRLKPDYAPPHYQLGKLRIRSHQPEAAVRELEEAVRLQPDLAQAYYQLSRAYALLGEDQKSRQALDTFNRSKKQELDESGEFTQELNKQLDSPPQGTTH
jgi:tetratricopeptide (TPR) repeat protein